MSITDEQIARTVHGAIRAFCESIGDRSIKPWDEAEDWQRADTYRVVAYHRAHPHAPPSAEHERWLKQKLADGWRLGPVKDSAARTNPALVPFDQLPPEQQAKDRIVKAIVNALA